MARGLYFAWQLPLAYFLSHAGLKGNILSIVIKDVVWELFNVNILSKAIVCDQGSNNRSAYLALGVTVDEPFIYVGSNKIVALYDIPYLFKNIRTNLQQNDFQFNSIAIL